MNKDDQLKVWNGIFGLVSVGGALLLLRMQSEAGTLRQLVSQPDNWLELAIYALVIFAMCKVAQIIVGIVTGGLK